MSIFNAETFLEKAVTGANDTKLIALTEAMYSGVVEKLVPRQWTSKDGTQTGVTMDVLFIVTDLVAKEQTGRDKVVVKYGCPLDLTPAGDLDMGKGKNVKLGRLREALNLNDPSKPLVWSDMQGREADLFVTQRVDGDDTYNDVKSVHKLGG